MLSKAEERARNQPEEEEDEAWYEWAWSKVKSGAKAVAGAVKDAVVAAYRYVKDRVKRFFSKVRELVNRGIPESERSAAASTAGFATR